MYLKLWKWAKFKIYKRLWKKIDFKPIRKSKKEEQKQNLLEIVIVIVKEKERENALETGSRDICSTFDWHMLLNVRRYLKVA